MGLVSVSNIDHNFNNLKSFLISVYIIKHITCGIYNVYNMFFALAYINSVLYYRLIFIHQHYVFVDGASLSILL